MDLFLYNRNKEIRARKCERRVANTNTNNGELFVGGCCKKCEKRTMFALFYKGKSANKMYFFAACRIIFFWNDWLFDRRDGSNSLPHRPIGHACPSCPSYVRLSHLFVTSVYHVCPSRCPSRLSVTSVHPVCPSVTSIRHVCPSHLSVTSVRHICQIKHKILKS